MAPLSNRMAPSSACSASMLEGKWASSACWGRRSRAGTMDIFRSYMRPAARGMRRPDRGGISCGQSCGQVWGTPLLDVQVLGHELGVLLNVAEAQLGLASHQGLDKV